MNEMTGYSLDIIDEGRYALETITEIRDLNSQKRKWSLEDIETVLGPIYTIGEFETYNQHTKTKKVPKVLKSRTFEDKILALIVENGVRYIDVVVDGYSIKFHTKNPKYYKYEYYLEFSKIRKVNLPSL